MFWGCSRLRFRSGFGPLISSFKPKWSPEVFGFHLILLIRLGKLRPHKALGPGRGGGGGGGGGRLARILASLGIACMRWCAAIISRVGHGGMAPVPST